MIDYQPKILIVDDRPANLVAISIVVGGNIGYASREALPFLEIISRNDHRRVRATAKQAMRQIQIAILEEDRLSGK